MDFFIVLFLIGLYFGIGWIVTNKYYTIANNMWDAILMYYLWPIYLYKTRKKK